MQLALKHRQGRNHKMRIVVFVGSPIEDDEKEVGLNKFCVIIPTLFEASMGILKLLLSIQLSA